MKKEQVKEGVKRHKVRHPIVEISNNRSNVDYHRITGNPLLTTSDFTAYAAWGRKLNVQS